MSLTPKLYSAVLNVPTCSEPEEDDLEISDNWLTENGKIILQECQLPCSMKVDRVCAIDLQRFQFNLFLNRCFVQGVNECKGKRKC